MFCFVRNGFKSVSERFRQKIVHLKKKYLQSEAFEKARANGKIIITEYGTAGATDPDKGIVSKFMSKKGLVLLIPNIYLKLFLKAWGRFFLDFGFFRRKKPIFLFLRYLRIEESYDHNFVTVVKSYVWRTF